MKKLIIAAMIACAVATSQAASFSWSQGSKQLAPDIDVTSIIAGHYGNGTDNLNGWNSLVWAYTINLDNGTKTDTVKGKGLSYTMNKISMIDFASSDVMFKPASGAPNNDVDFSIIITADYTDTNGNKWTITSDAVVGSVSISELSDLSLAAENFTGWTVTSSSVPEPTSGMLLLLGMAGLALRRRRA